MTFVLTREQAYELAWSAPLISLAATMGISNVALGKSLRSGGIPLPGPGYWNKLKVGKAVKRIALTAPHLGTVRFVHISGKLSGLVRASITGEPGERDIPWEPLEVLKDRFVKSLPGLTLPKGTNWTHQGVQRLRAKDERTIEKAKTAHPVLAQFYRPKFGDALGVRRLQFINRLAYALEKIGGGLSISDDEASELALYTGSSSATCRIQFRDQDLCMSDFSVDRYSTTFRPRWADSETGRIENELSEIVVAAAVAAWESEVKWLEQVKALRRQREAELRADAARAKAAEDEQSRQNAKKAQKRARKRLAAAARGADEATLIRNYVLQAKERLAGDVAPDVLAAWLEWALNFADNMDPWKNGDAQSLVTNWPGPPSQARTVTGREDSE